MEIRATLIALGTPRSFDYVNQRNEQCTQTVYPCVLSNGIDTFAAELRRSPQELGLKVYETYNVRCTMFARKVNDSFFTSITVNEIKNGKSQQLQGAQANS